MVALEHQHGVQYRGVQVWHGRDCIGKDGSMELVVVSIEKPEEINFILGNPILLKTVEDIHEALINTVPGIRFDWLSVRHPVPAWCAGRVRMRRWWRFARKNALAIGAGHSFILFLGAGIIQSMSCPPCAMCRKSATSSAPRQTPPRSSLRIPGEDAVFWVWWMARSPGVWKAMKTLPGARASCEKLATSWVRNLLNAGSVLYKGQLVAARIWK